MALSDITNVSISLQTSGISRLGFGTPLFITAHNFFLDRVREYSGLSEVAADFPTDSNAYKAAVSVFKNEPSVGKFKIGRQKANTLVTVGGDTGGTYVAGVTVGLTVTDAVGGTVDATFTTSGAESLATVAANLVADINGVIGSGGTATVTVTDNLDGTFVIAPATQDFYVSGFVNVSTSATGIDDTAADADNILNTLTAIREVDDDFYFVGWEGRALGGESIDNVTYNTVGVWDLANTIEALDSPKMYFVGSSASESITNTYTAGSTPASQNDVLAFLAEGNYFRTVTWWHQDADTTFSEMQYCGYNAPFDAGSVTWGNIKLSIDAAKNASGNKLTSTEKGRLASRYANYAAIAGGVVYVLNGKVAGNEWIDIIRGRDNLKADLEADLFDLLTNQQGSKIPYTDKGINQVAGVVDGRLVRYRDDREFLTNPIKLNVPKAADIATEDKQNRILEDMSFTATIAGAIQAVDLSGTLTY